MISTLLTQEFLSTRNRFATSIGIVLLVVAVSFATAALRIPVLGDLGFGLGVFAVAAITPLVLGLLAENYWRTMYGREGYFTMTLPVSGRTLFWAKVLYGFVATLVALGITLIGLAGALIAFALSQGTSVSLTLEELWNTLGVFGPATVWFLAVCTALQFGFTVVAGAAIMSIGAEARFNHLGFGAPVIGAVILYFIMQIVGLAAVLFVPFGMRIAGPDAGTLVAEGMFHDFMGSVTDTTGSIEPTVVGLGIVLVSVIVTVLLAWRGARSVERHTSLR